MAIDYEQSERRPSMAEVLRRAIDAAQSDVRIWTPGRVIKFDASTQKADVKPLIKEAYLTEEGDRAVESLPVITSLPVEFLSAGNFVFYCPVQEGTLGAIEFCARSLDKWLSGTGQEVDPEIDHEHGISDAKFVPGLNPFGAPLSGLPSDHAVAGELGGMLIHFRKLSIMIGDDNLVAAQNGVVLGGGIDPFTGSTYFALQNASSVVMAKKI